jgi:hypothetical protein
MRGVIWQTWWTAIDTLPPDIFARLHWRISLFPAASHCIHCAAGCRAHEPGGLDYGSLVAVAALHCPSVESLGSSIVLRMAPRREMLDSVGKNKLIILLTNEMGYGRHLIN